MDTCFQAHLRGCAQHDCTPACTVALGWWFTQTLALLALGCALGRPLLCHKELASTWLD